jgi:hypothetical protein
MSAIVIIAALGSKAFWLLYLWLGSAWLSSALSSRKGYGEKVGLGTGLLLTFIGVIIWLLVPAKPHSVWKERGLRRAKAEGVDVEPSP